MNKKILLLDINYQVQNFIDIRRAISLIIRERAELVERWQNEVITFASGTMEYPAIMRLNGSSRRNYINVNFNRNALVKRDKNRCQYCGKKIIGSAITIDHVIPKAQGGGTSFTNCVVACHPCNNRKGCQTPEQARMPLLRKPHHPFFISAKHLMDTTEDFHASWEDYLPLKAE